MALTRREIIVGGLTLTASYTHAQTVGQSEVTQPEDVSNPEAELKTFHSVSALLNAPEKTGFTSGDTIKAGPYLYEVIAATSADYHVITAGGIKLRVLCDHTVSPSQFGLEPEISAPDNSEKFQKFIDFISETGCKGQAKAGTYLLPESVSARFVKGTEYAFTLSGAGNGTIFHFLTGSLKIHRGNHILSDFRVKSDTDHGIQIAPINIGQDSRSETAPRGAMYNVRAEYCAKSGFYFEYCWIYTMVNCFGRYCGAFGLQLGDGKSVGCNAFNLVGGEWQGNGKAVQKGAKKSTGGGIFIGRSVHVDLNTTIEGNYSDGLVIGEQVRGISVSGYFEKNGSSHLDLDIQTLRPRSPSKAAADILISVVNFTAQNLNGKAQLRAMKFIDVQNLKITHAKFFKQHKNGGVIYKKEPILVMETKKGQSSGWVENCSYVALDYKQAFLRNECDRFGFPDKTIVASPVVFSARAEMEYDYVLPHDIVSDGRRVDTRCVLQITGAKPPHRQRSVRMLTRYAKGSSGKTVIEKTNIISFKAKDKFADFETQTSKNWDGFIHITFARNGNHLLDNLSSDIKIPRIEITTYRGYR